MLISSTTLCNSNFVTQSDALTLHKSLHENLPLLYLTVDAEGRIRTISRWGATRLGYAINELEQSSIFNLFVQAQRAIIHNWITNFFKRGASCSVLPKALNKVQVVGKNGLMFRTKVVAFKLNDCNQQLIGLLCEDLIEENEADGITQDEAWLYSLANTLPVKLCLFNLDGECVFLNRAWIDFTGQSLQHLGKGNRWIEQLHPQDRQRYWNDFNSASQYRRQFTTKYRLRQASGDYCMVTHTAIPRFKSNGNFLGYIACAVDEVDQGLESHEVDAAINDLSSKIIYRLRVPVANMKIALHLLMLSIDPQQDFLSQLSDDWRKERVATYFHIFYRELQQQAKMLEDLSTTKF
jgi:PAS domain S-box-containing protein